MTFLHKEFCIILERSLSTFLHEKGFNPQQFDKAIHRAFKQDVTSDDSVIVKLLLTATNFVTFENMLHNATTKHKHNKRGLRVQLQPNIPQTNVDIDHHVVKETK
jgi:hypothetical protein